MANIYCRIATTNNSKRIKDTIIYFKIDNSGYYKYNKLISPNQTFNFVHIFNNIDITISHIIYVYDSKFELIDTHILNVGATIVYGDIIYTNYLNYIDCTFPVTNNSSTSIEVEIFFELNSDGKIYYKYNIPSNTTYNFTHRYLLDYSITNIVKTFDSLSNEIDSINISNLSNFVVTINANYGEDINYNDVINCNVSIENINNFDRTCNCLINLNNSNCYIPINTIIQANDTFNLECTFENIDIFQENIVTAIDLQNNTIGSVTIPATQYQNLQYTELQTGVTTNNYFAAISPALLQKTGFIIPLFDLYIAIAIPQTGALVTITNFIKIFYPANTISLNITTFINSFYYCEYLTISSQSSITCDFGTIQKMKQLRYLFLTSASNNLKIGGDELRRLKKLQYFHVNAARGLYINAGVIGSLTGLIYLRLRDFAYCVINQAEIGQLILLRTLRIEEISSVASWVTITNELQLLVYLIEVYIVGYSSGYAITQGEDTITAWTSMSSGSTIYVDGRGRVWWTISDNEVFRTSSITLNSCHLTSDSIDNVILRYAALIQAGTLIPTTSKSINLGGITNSRRTHASDAAYTYLLSLGYGLTCYNPNTDKGYLYNWYVVDSDKIAPAGTHVPTSAEWDTLLTFLGGAANAGGKLKETGTTYWDSPNTGATNETGFTGRGVGYRFDSSGAFGLNKQVSQLWARSEANATQAYRCRLDYNTIAVTTTAVAKKLGFCIRCLIDDPDSWTPGMTVTDIEGNVYGTTKIGTQVWLTSDLITAHFNDGTGIPHIPDNTMWINLTTPGFCSYGNL